MTQRKVASVPSRLAAYAFDAVATAIPLGIVMFTVTVDPLAAVLISQFVYLVYFTTLWSSLGRGRTFGMRITGIRVLRINGSHLSLPRAALRYGVLVIGLALFGLGVVSALFDERRRAWHDIVTGTLVVNDLP